MGAIVLQHEVDESSLLLDLSCQPEQVDAATLEERFFVWPVRWRCDGVDLFDWSFNPGTPWWSLPALGFGTRCLDAFRSVREFGEHWMRLPGGGWLRWTNACGVVTIECWISGRSFRLHAADLAVAVQHYRAGVAQDLISRYPRMALHGSWRHWDSRVPRAVT